ncbi:MAG TPA: hypothetical protein VIN75_24925, partial [Burkholderiaceae bacterium]
MKRSLLNTASAILLLTGSMAGCDSVPEAPGARGLGAAAQAPAERAVPDSPIVPVAGKPVLWGYVDGAGIAHFASSQVDGRYEQVLRETEGRRVVGKTQGTDGLLTWLEISPDVKALQPVLDEAAQAPAERAVPSAPIVPVAGKPVLWGYVDGAGVAHFASSQIDGRYEQVLRETDGRRVAGKT